MAKKSNVVPISPALGRKSAYVARNRAALIRAAQHVFAESGPTASIESVAAFAEVSPSTIYKHFETKENLLSLAILEAFSSWQEWAQEKSRISDDPLVQFVLPMRLFLRIKTTHPLYARLASSCFGDTYKLLPITNTGFAEQLHFLVKSKVLSVDNLDVRVSNLGSCLFGILNSQLHQADSTAEDADTALEIALGMICIPAAKAKRITHLPLPDFSI